MILSTERDILIFFNAEETESTLSDNDSLEKNMEPTESNKYIYLLLLSSGTGS